MRAERNDPVINWIAPNECPRSGDTDRRSGDSIKHTPVEKPNAASRRKTLLGRFLRDDLEDRIEPVTPGVELVRKRQQLSGEILGSHRINC